MQLKKSRLLWMFVLFNFLNLLFSGVVFGQAPVSKDLRVEKEITEWFDKELISAYSNRIFRSKGLTSEEFISILNKVIRLESLTKILNLDFLKVILNGTMLNLKVLAESDLRDTQVEPKQSITEAKKPSSSSTGSSKRANRDTSPSFVEVNGIKLEPESLILELGQVETIKVVISPQNATNKNVTWLSDNPRVTKVDTTGRVVALAPGYATISATTEDGSYSASCLIQVIESIVEPFDPTEEALSAVNNASDAKALKAIIAEQGQFLNLSLEEYNRLDDKLKLLVCSDLIDNRPKEGYNLAELPFFFRELVKTSQTVQDSLTIVNNAQEILELQGLSWLEMILGNLKKIKMCSIYRGENIRDLSEDLEQLGKWYSLLDTSYQQSVLQKIIEKRPFEGYTSLTGVRNELTLVLEEITPEQLVVYSYEEMLTALSLYQVKTISLAADFTTYVTIAIKRPVTIIGNNHTISFAHDLVGWQGNFILHVCRAAEAVEIKDINLTRGDGALLVDGAKVILTGEVNVSGNEFGGIKLEDRWAESQLALIMVDANLINNTEAYGFPTIWGATGQISGYQLTQIIKNNLTHYYIDKNNSLSPVSFIKAKAESDLIVAIDNEAKTIVVISGTTAGALRRAVESTDGSKQHYWVKDSSGSRYLAEYHNVGNGSLLLIVAENGDEVHYTITVVSSN